MLELFIVIIGVTIIGIMILLNPIFLLALGIGAFLSILYYLGKARAEYEIHMKATHTGNKCMCTDCHSGHPENCEDPDSMPTPSYVNQDPDIPCSTRPHVTR